MTFYINQSTSSDLIHLLETTPHQVIVEPISANLATIKNHRRVEKRNFINSIEQLFFQTLVRIVCGCNNWEEISIYGKLKKDWFGNYFFYKKGMPSEDMFERFFGALCKESFNQFFINWASKSLQYFENEVISIDGKRIKGSYDKAIEQ